MEQFDLYQDIATRTGGDIYIGVVGPVRTGKSTFITKFMQTLVLPNMQDEHRKQRMIDELPQSADGKTVMTTQPKFVPDGGVRVSLGEGLEANVRLIDCVGYPCDGAQGFKEGEKSRLVSTPWSEEEMPFEQAAELGTQKVIHDHSTIGIVVTTDGSITDLPRSEYEQAEQRVIREMQQLGKPFVIVLNTKHPSDSATMRLRDELQQTYVAPVLSMSVADLTEQDLGKLLQGVLMQFPLKRFELAMPTWLQALPRESEIVSHLLDRVGEVAREVHAMRDYGKVCEMFDQDDPYLLPSGQCDVDFGTGSVVLTINPRPELFYRVLSEQCGQTIENDFQLVSYLKELAIAKQHYDKLKTALAEVEEFGYGVVTPTLDDMDFRPPHIVRKGSRYGVKLRASAPSYHIMRVDVETEVSPLIGGEAQSKEILESWLGEFGEDGSGIWQTNMLGKSLNQLAQEHLGSKLMSMPEDARNKLRRTVTRIVNEGKGGVLCILL